ncbi:hypothetical protein GC207_09740 [bacterium]|nr:hypothetical protein [bacterium]
MPFRFVLLAGLSFWISSSALAAEQTVNWIRAGLTTNAPIWGIEGGLQFALHPAGFTGNSGGPRGLIRLGYPTLPNGGYDLINFIAVEPIVSHQRGFSELEKSAFDQKNGRVFWTGDIDQPVVKSPQLDPGTISTVGPGVEELAVTVFIERFTNGAHVRLKLSQRSDRPDELKLTVTADQDSAPIDACILTATMGNKARTRILFLADGPVSSLQLYPDYQDVNFAEHTIIDLDRLPRSKDGDVLVAIANDESDPSSVQPFGRPYFWDYQGAKVTQYWRKPAAEVAPDLKAIVNARYTYWMSKQPIPGGIAFENFEMREPFVSGRSFFFGITRHNPLELLR